MIKLWNTYNKVKNIFKKPKLRWYFGKWRNDPCLPIWRSGNVIRFAKYNEYTREYNVVRYIGSKWNDLGKKNHPILSKIFKPMYVLPTWLSFYIFNRDINWKNKYNEYRFEYPGQFTIMFFGLSLSFWLQNPTGDIKYDSDYWESILWYLELKDLDAVEKEMGHYEENGKIYSCFNKELFLKMIAIILFIINAYLVTITDDYRIL